MITLSEVSSIIENAATGLGTEMIPVTDSFGRVLQEDILADMDMPPFDKSAMDGYACRREDMSNRLEVLETIQAGRLPTTIIRHNQCSKIMTGAAIPYGANSVFMIEHAETAGENLIKCNNLKTKDNICFKGEDYRKGDILIKAGIKISPVHIGIMAGAGYNRVLVSKQPHAAVLATGTELVEPGVMPEAGQIRNSNSCQLTAMLHSMQIPCNYYGIVTDDLKQITITFEKILVDNEIVIITGGASKGDFDYVPVMLHSQDFEILVEKTGIQPGNPMIFSRKLQKFCFGLSGNPVSSYVQFELFVKPFIYKRMQCNWQPLQVKGRLLNDFSREKAVRFGIMPVKLTRDNMIETVDFHGSAHLNALAYANALMEVPAGVAQIKKGEEVYVRPI